MTLKFLKEVAKGKITEGNEFCRQPLCNISVCRLIGILAYWYRLDSLAWQRIRMLLYLCNSRVLFFFSTLRKHKHNLVALFPAIVQWRDNSKWFIPVSCSYGIVSWLISHCNISPDKNLGLLFDICNNNSHFKNLGLLFDFCNNNLHFKSCGYGDLFPMIISFYWNYWTLQIVYNPPAQMHFCWWSIIFIELKSYGNFFCL